MSDDGSSHDGGMSRVDACLTPEILASGMLATALELYDETQDIEAVRKLVHRERNGLISKLSRAEAEAFDQHFIDLLLDYLEEAA